MPRPNDKSYSAAAILGLPTKLGDVAEALHDDRNNSPIPVPEPELGQELVVLGAEHGGSSRFDFREDWRGRGKTSTQARLREVGWRSVIAAFMAGRRGQILGLLSAPIAIT